MRLNIDWVAPWMYGRPRGGWWFHRWHSDKGIISGGKARNKPTISGKKASATPPAFRDLLISLAAAASVRAAA